MGSPLSWCQTEDYLCSPLGLRELRDRERNRERHRERETERETQRERERERRNNIDRNERDCMLAVQMASLVEE